MKTLRIPAIAGSVPASAAAATMTRKEPVSTLRFEVSTANAAIARVTAQGVELGVGDRPARLRR